LLLLLLVAVAGCLAEVSDFPAKAGFANNGSRPTSAAMTDARTDCRLFLPNVGRKQQVVGGVRRGSPISRPSIPSR